MQPDADKLASKSVTDPEVVVTENNDRKLLKVTKWKIIAAAVVLVTLIVIGGIVGAVYLTGHVINQHKMEKTVFLRTGTEPTVEKVSVDTEKETEQFDLESKQFRVIHDFKKGLTMYRMVTDGKSVCIVTPMERQYIQNPKTLMNAMKNEDGADPIQTVDIANNSNPDAEEQDSTKLMFSYSNEDVKDRSIFPLEIRESCQDSELYWAVKTTEPSNNGTTEATQGERVKRWVRRRLRRVKRCFYIFVSRRWYYRYIRRCRWIYVG